VTPDRLCKAVLKESTDGVYLTELTSHQAIDSFAEQREARESSMQSFSIQRGLQHFLVLASSCPDTYDMI